VDVVRGRPVRTTSRVISLLGREHRAVAPAQNDDVSARAHEILDRLPFQHYQRSMDASRCKWDVGEVGCGCNNLSGLLLGRSRPWP
jgi:hypothetical protein